MPTFRYKAVTEPGEVVHGFLDAPDQEAVIEQLRLKGYLPIRADRLEQASLSRWFHRELSSKRHIRRQETAGILRELATLLQAGLTLDQSLDTAIRFSDRPAVRALLKGVVDRVRGGASLSQAFAAEERTFDRFCLGMMRAGEAGGSLDKVLARTAESLERSMKSRQNFHSALIYPAVLLVTSLLAVGVVVTVVVPSFKDVFDQAGYALPLATRIVLAVGTTAQTFWWLPLVLIALGLLVAQQIRRDPAGRREWDRRLLSIPLLGPLLAKAETARMSYTLGMLLSNGVPLLSALAIVKETLSNAAMVHAFEHLQERVKEGKSLAAPLEETRLFPTLATHLLRIGEESGRLEDMLFRIADTYEQDFQRSVQRFLTLLVPALTLFMAIIIAGIIMAILVPMLSIQELAL
jgi:general secretion pathway protein F